MSSSQSGANPITRWCANFASTACSFTVRPGRSSATLSVRRLAHKLGGAKRAGTNSSSVGSETVVGLELALVHGRPFPAGTGSACAGCPTEVKLRAERKDHVNAIEFGLETHAFRTSRQGEAE